MEPGLICYECVGTHPGCGLTDFDSRWYWGKICPRSDDRCVKVRRHLSTFLMGEALGVSAQSRPEGFLQFVICDSPRHSLTGLLS